MKKLLAFVVFATLIVSCKPEIDSPNLRSNLADVSKVVYVGDSYLSGYQDGALFEEGQGRSVAALLSRSFEALEGTPISQAVIAYDGGIGINSKPWNGELISKSILHDNVPDCTGELGLKPLKSEFSYSGSASYVTYSGDKSLLTDYSIPFASSGDLISTSTGEAFDAGGNLYFHRMRSATGLSPLNEVVSKNGSFAVIWTGMEDVYRYCRKGGVGVTLPTVSQFEANLDSILSSLPTNSQQGVIANIPAVNSFPYYTLVAYNGADLTQNKADSLNDIYHLGGGYPHINFHVGEGNAFVIEDATYPGGLRQMQEGECITLSIPIDSMKCHFMGLLVNAIPDEYSLDSTEMALVNQTIFGYNAIIQQKAEEYNIALVDMEEYFSGLNDGIVYNGSLYNNEFVSGNFFGLDGFHPTQKANVLMANEFIRAINRHYDATFPLVYCPECVSVLFP